jgi:hypothetical protein
MADQVIDAFLRLTDLRKGNIRSKDMVLYLFDNAIARYRPENNYELEITTQGWETPTTKKYLNKLPNVKVYNKKGYLYLNDEKWDGEWKTIPLSNATN